MKVYSTALFSIFLAGAMAAGALAQTVTVEKRSGVFMRAGSGDHIEFPDTFEFVSSEMFFGGKKKVVKSAPFSAEAVTETTQNLSDGNRIQRKSSASLFRDSEGRTRQEHKMEGIGPWASRGGPHEMISIYDPVAEVSYSLDPKARTARISSGRTFDVLIGGTEGGAAAQVHEKISALHLRTKSVERGAVEPQGESLGMRVIEGVAAEGHRSTMTIAAGEIGNDRPIQVVNERWYSPELDLVIMTRRSDPRSGERVYKLTNITRNEPSRALFEVPSDYTVKDDSSLLDKAKRMLQPRSGREL